MKLDVPFYPQERAYTCGPACLRMVLAFYGMVRTEAELEQQCGTTVVGTARGQLWQVATSLGFAAQLPRLADGADVKAWLTQGIPVIAMVNPTLLHRSGQGITHGIVIVGRTLIA